MLVFLGFRFFQNEKLSQSLEIKLSFRNYTEFRDYTEFRGFELNAITQHEANLIN